MNGLADKELFENIPVPKAVARLAVPAIVSQIVTIVYNLADTFFIGQLGNTSMVAAVTVVSPWFNLLTALGNLFGIGGSSLVSRLLGEKKEEEVKKVSAFGFYACIAVTALFAFITYLLQTPILRFLNTGEGVDSLDFAAQYMQWVVVIGGVPTVCGMTLAHFLRGEGRAKTASAGMMFGGILNMALDPLFMFAFGWGFVGAGMATACSNLASCIFFVVIYIVTKKKSCLSLNPRHFSFRYAVKTLSKGFASALTTALANAANMVIVRLSSAYGDAALAAYGIVKRIDSFPLGISLGLCQGFMPLVSYNYAAKNYYRMRKVSVFSWIAAMILSLCFVVCFLSFAPQIHRAFISDEETVALGAVFLRIACTAVPLTAVNALIIYTLQAMGKGTRATVLTICRQGALNIPVLFLMNFLIGLYGMIWTQLIIEVIMLPITVGMYIATFRRLKRNVTQGGTE